MAGSENYRVAASSDFDDSGIPMFDILVYLFENYLHAEACPESEQLARKLTAAGFEEEEISEALEWFSGLRAADNAVAMIGTPTPGSIRIYAPEELSCLSAVCRGFLSFLESAGMIDPLIRERIIERAMALSGFNLTLHRFKVIVLMVQWQQDCQFDTLMLDELLNDSDEEGWLQSH